MYHRRSTYAGTRPPSDRRRCGRPTDPRQGVPRRIWGSPGRCAGRPIPPAKSLARRQHCTHWPGPASLLKTRPGLRRAVVRHADLPFTSLRRVARRKVRALLAAAMGVLRSLLSSGGLAALSAARHLRRISSSGLGCFKRFKLDQLPRLVEGARSAAQRGPAWVCPASWSGVCRLGTGQALPSDHADQWAKIFADHGGQTI